MCKKCIDYTQPMAQFTVFIGRVTGAKYLLVSDPTHYDEVWGFSRVVRRF